MYKIDTAQNRIAPLAAKRFGELGFTERKHLKEWLENCPQALAQVDVDELLIIQKEFYGFDDTRERLDLLAIDKDGKLVIIENKLDDTGRDVVWQAHQRVLCGAYDRRWDYLTRNISLSSGALSGCFGGAAARG
jgi:hypothetical protein